MPDQHPLLEKFGVAAVLAALLALALMAWLALRPVAPPRTLGADAAAADFAASRALPAFRFLSRTPRPVASDANASARAWIVERLQSMELEPEVQTAAAQKIGSAFASDYRVSVGVVSNVLVRVKGAAADSAGRPALLLATHYDSAPGKPGADAPVAAMLETLRALQHGAPLANDVIVLFADAHEAGALGARAFAGQHRWARDVGLVLQFDAASGADAPMLVASRGGDGKLVAGWIDAAPQARGTSAFAVLARATPALAQRSPLDQIGQAGLRFASGERSALQHTGETMLALARHFGNTPLAGIASANSIHFELPFAGQVHYSSQHVWAITRLVCFVFVLACCMAVKYLDLEPQMLVAGAMAFVMLVLALASIAITLWKGWPGLHESYQRADAARGRDGWYFLAYVTLGSALFIELQRLMHKTLGVPAVTLGALLVLLFALIGTSAMLPGASYLLAWPMLAALLAFSLLNIPRVKAWPQGGRLALMVAAAAPAVLLIAPLLQQVFTLFTPERSALLMIVLSVMLGLASTLLAAVRRRFVAPALLVMCAGAILTAQAGSEQPLREAARKSGDRQWTARAVRAHAAFPHLFALKDTDDGGRRKVAFSLRSMNNAPTIELRVIGEVLASRLNGRLLTDRSARSWSMKLHGTGKQEHRIELELPSGGTARVHMAERIPDATGAASDTLVFR